MENWWAHLLCGALFLLLDSAVHARILAVDVWGDKGVVEVFHTPRQLQTSAPYCVAIAGADQTKLQDALDWVCGPTPSGGGVDCSAISQTGSCYQPNTLQGHCSYAFNKYYVQQNGASDSCSFGGLATTTSTDPSSGSCIYPALGSSGSSSSSSNSSTSFSPSPSSNGGTFTTTSPTSNAMHTGLLTLSWVHTCCTLMVVFVLASRL